MRHRPFGITAREVAAVGQGTWLIEDGDRREAVAALRRGLDLGMNHIDTAEMYGDGAAEEIIGEAIASRRDEVFLVSKVLPQNASRAGTLAACERSLRHLATDRLDCYLLHWRGRHPLAQTIAAFADLIRAGKILSWGVSNFDTDDLDEAQSAAETVAGAGAIACNQVLYHLGERHIEHAVIPWCETHGVAVTGYSPFGHDDFPNSRSAGGRVLAEIARAHGATPRQVALAFLVRQPNVFTIPKAGSIAHVEENAGDLELDPDEIARVAAAFPLGPPKRGLPML
ncbi:MAG: aldo/keto reductase [Xanthobacteraceae bacterium]|nr:aldo/keto reductase [Xanthobacteraceae bacterium]